MVNTCCRVIFGFLVLAVVGCAGSPSAQFYLLNAMPGMQAPVCRVSEQQTIAIGIGPVVLADYLNRPQIITRPESNQIRAAEFHRWAGSLERDFRRVLVDNLGLMLAPEQIVVYPFNSAERCHFRVAVDVVRFDGLLSQQANLEARWTLINQQSGKTITSCKVSFSAPVAGERYQDLVMAMSRTISRLSTHIAKAVKQHIKDS